MEIILLLIIAALACAAICLLWKCRDLERGIYDFSRRLDGTLNRMLDGKRLEAEPYEKDDLWGMIYERLLRLSDMYTHKEKEITEEKETLKELVSDISHQTKTPLANIRLYLEMMAEDMAAEERENVDSECRKPEEKTAEKTEGGLPGAAEPGNPRAVLEKMTGQVDKLDFLLQSMVKMSRLETGTIKIRKQRQPLTDTLAAAISAVIPKADQKKIRISVDYEEGLELEHDRKWTSEALYNILDNAVKYTDPGGRIDISVCRQEIFTKISVRDTGKGIAPERQGAVFTRFYREPEIHDSEGIGIGLYLARKIITMQNGYIEVRSEPGRGSTFLIYLPEGN